MGARRKGRELAVQMLYQWDVGRAPVEDVIASTADLQSAGDAARALASQLLEGAVDRVEEIDGILAEHSDNWRLGRMSTVDRNILRLAVYELLSKTTPPSVVINEALEITKRFSTKESTAFVNGVLDGVNASIEAKTGE
ncbi:MAG: transcription antitermination factor NusB [Vicinamibacteria bacterium]